LTKKHKSEPADPIAEYQEWVENRYNPGHYLGGTLPPAIRRAQTMFTWKEKRVLGFLVAIVILALLALVVRQLLRA
jgi:hypothetical protein